MSYRIENATISSSLRINMIRNQASARNAERLGTGMRINRARDDASGAAISDRLRYQTLGLRGASRNLQDGLSALQTADGGLREVANLLQRGKTLAIQAANDAMSDADRQVLQTEMNNIIESLNDLTSRVVFNGRRLLGPPPDQPQFADIVFSIDSSGSMAAEINTIRNGLGQFIQNLRNLSLPWRIAVEDMNGTRYDGPEVDFSAAPESPGNVVVAPPNDAVGREFPDVFAGGNPLGVPIDPTGEDLTQDFTSSETTSQTAVDNILSVWDSDGAGPDPGVTTGFVQPYEGINEILPGGTETPSYNKLGLKFIIQATDVSNPAGELDTSNEAAAAANLQANKATYFGIVPDTDGATAGVQNTLYDDLASSTGGQLFDINAADYTPLFNAVSSAVQNALRVDPIVLHSGAHQDETLTLNIPLDVRAISLGVADVDVTTRTGAEDAIQSFDNALITVAQHQSRIGADMNRVEDAIEVVESGFQNHARAESQLKDLDFSEEVVDLTRNNILNQFATNVLERVNNQHLGGLSALVDTVA